MTHLRHAVIAAVIAPALLLAQAKKASPPSESEDGIHLSGMPLRSVILQAYRLAPAQLHSPYWMSLARIDLAGQLAPGTKPDQVRMILRQFLADQFRLTLKHQERMMKVYLLEVAEGGAKLDQTPAWDRRPGECVGSRHGSSLCHGMSMSKLASRMQSQYRRLDLGPVLDRTGLKGAFDFEYQSVSGYSSGGQLFSPALAMRDQLKPLGLTIEERKEPVEVFSVVHCDRTPKSTRFNWPLQGSPSSGADTSSAAP